jgi:hypothetical protein
MVTASCGSAAILVGGSTLHSALGIPPGLNPPPHTELIGATWSQVDVLFTDEFCMVSAFSRFSINVYDSSKYVQKSHFSEFI